MKIPIRIKSLNPDRTQFKKYGLMCEPDNLWVELEIDDKEVVSDITEMGDSYFVTEAGLKQIVSRLADIVDEIETEHLKQIQKKQG